MPYSWTNNAEVAPAPARRELHLWPHQSLAPAGFAGFIAVTFVFLTLPLFALLGTVLLWGLLPFLMLALAALWFALGRSRRDAQVLEVLTLSPDRAH
ncbi:MAG: DUF2244 domain-containing protein, partial [Paracoccaceae bacterium]